MNRIFRLLGVVLAFIWLQGGVSEVGTLFGREPREIGELTEPYWTCSGWTCVMNEGCGENTCESDQDCGACDPYLWSQCINGDGSWNEDPLCSCDMPACYAADRQQCADDWGTWHEDGCWCESCNPYDVFVTTYPEEIPLGCVDCCNREYNVVSWELYYQYCQDGRFRGQYTVGTGYLDYYVDIACVWNSYPWCPEEYWNPYYQCY